MSLVIRDIPIEPRLILAPMEGVTDVVFRRLVRRIGGCGLTVTEFIAAEALRRNVKKILQMAEFDADESPLSIQIYGRNPEAMAEGAKMVQDLGADIVDLNMGCPSKKVCAHSGGSALMKEPELAKEIVRAMRGAVDIPFTVKMRSGWDHDNKNAPEIAYMCQEEGAEMVAVHWRTRTDQYGGVRELDTIRQVVDTLSIPVVANGDIIDAASALDTLERTGCAGLMIGRGAIRNPWVFREIEAALKGEPALSVEFGDRKDVLLGYLADIRDRFHSERGTLGRFKKISGYFTKGVPFGSELRQGIFHSQEIEQAIDVVETFFDTLDDRLEPRHRAHLRSA
ncbi:MAG: tRNA dihydrouridine synthase DusB [Proteobacteria bacterium]|nr:tRNA dihydrouridine synthase DusB [Pseudomonadota bacterium]